MRYVKLCKLKSLQLMHFHRNQLWNCQVKRLLLPIEKDVTLRKILKVISLQIPSLCWIFIDGFVFIDKFTDCHLLAEFLKTNENDLQKAVKLYRVNCDQYGYAKSCLEYGNFAFVGVKEKNVQSDPIEALKYFEKGCSLGSSDNCLNSGMLLVSPMLTKTAIKRDIPKVYRVTILPITFMRISN